MVATSLPDARVNPTHLSFKRFLSPDIPFILLSLSHVIIKGVLACISCLFFMSFGGDAMAESWSNIESNHSW